MVNNRVILVFLLSSVLFLAGCMPFGTDKAARCADDLVNCNFYTGSEGVEFRLQNPPRTLYFHSYDAHPTDPVGNRVDFDIRVANRGASETYGATFLTGFGSNFRIIRPDGTEISKRGVLDSCTFNIGVGDGSIFSSFAIRCEGLDFQRSDWGTTFNARFSTLNDIFGWNLPDGQIRIFDDGDGLDFTLGLEGMRLDLYYHGKILLGMISHINLDYYGGAEFWLRGDNPEYPGGEEDFQTYTVQMLGNWPAGTDRYTMNYQVKSCYAYTTFVSPLVCVDPSPYSGDDKVCRTNQAVNMGTQGAPVAVTRMEQYNTGRTLELIFTVRNVGGGQVWEIGSLERCSPYYPDTRITSGHKNIIYVGYAEIGGVGLRCDRREIRLNERGEGTFRCTYNLADSDTLVGSAYEAPIRMELWYGYEKSITRSLEIMRAS